MAPDSLASELSVALLATEVAEEVISPLVDAALVPVLFVSVAAVLEPLALDALLLDAADVVVGETLLDAALEPFVVVVAVVVLELGAVLVALVSVALGLGVVSGVPASWEHAQTSKPAPSSVTCVLGANRDNADRLTAERSKAARAAHEKRGEAMVLSSSECATRHWATTAADTP